MTYFYLCAIAVAVPQKATDKTITRRVSVCLFVCLSVCISVSTAIIAFSTDLS